MISTLFIYLLLVCFQITTHTDNSQQEIRDYSSVPKFQVFNILPLKSVLSQNQYLPLNLQIKNYTKHGNTYFKRKGKKTPTPSEKKKSLARLGSLTVTREAKAAQEEQAVVQAGEEREAAAERVVSEEELEDGGLPVPAGAPVGVGHGELVEVRQQWRDPVPNGPLYSFACVPARSCHDVCEC